MKLFLKQIDIPYQVDESVFINQPLMYWTDNNTRVAPYFSGVIKSIEVIINPKSRFIRNKGEQTILLIDIIRYEILPHSHFNPFGQVEIFDQVEIGSKLFATEQALLNASVTNSSIYHAKGEVLNITTSL